MLAASIRIGNAGYFGAIRVISTRDHLATNERANFRPSHCDRAEGKVLRHGPRGRFSQVTLAKRVSGCSATPAGSGTDSMPGSARPIEARLVPMVMSSVKAVPGGAAFRGQFEVF